MVMGMSADSSVEKSRRAKKEKRTAGGDMVGEHVTVKKGKKDSGFASALGTYDQVGVQKKHPERTKHKKKRKMKLEEENCEENASDLPQSDSNDGGSEDFVNVDIEFFDPKPIDFHGVKALLKSYLDENVWDSSGFVDLILNQVSVGSVVKIADEDSPIGIITALNWARYQDCLCMLQLRDFLEKSSSNQSNRSRLDELWNKDAKDVGLLVSERLVNIPFDMAPPLHQSLFDEISWAIEDEPEQSLRDSFKFKQYLLLTRIYEEIPKQPKKSGKSSEKTNEDSKVSNFVFIKPEDEIFLQLSSWSFTFPVKAESLATRETRGMRQLRLVMAIEEKQVGAFMSRLKNFAAHDT